MDMELTPTTCASFSEVLDRVLDKGVVIEAEISFQLTGLTLASAQARIVVTSIETYLEYADLIATSEPVLWRPVVRRDLLDVDGGAPRERGLSTSSIENRIRDYFESG